MKYWTEETITHVDHTYIKGRFQGKYYAERQESWSNHHVEFFNMHIYEAEVELEEVRKPGQQPFSENQDLPIFGGTLAQPVTCYDRQADAWFRLNIEEPRLGDIQLSRIVKEGNEHMGTITGTLYGCLNKLRTEQLKVAHELPDPAVPSPSIINHHDWTRTTTHEFSYQNGQRYRRDYYRHVNGSFRWGQWYAVSQPRTFFSVFRWMFGLGLMSLSLIFLIGLSWPGLILLGLIFGLLMIRRGVRYGLGSAIFSFFYGGMLLFLLAIFGIGLYGNFQHESPVIAPHKAKSSVTTRPLKHRNKNSSSGDWWIIHHRAWSDLNGNTYEGDVKVLNSAYLLAEKAHRQLSQPMAFSDVYRALILTDATHLQGVYTLFDSLRTARALDTVGFANMLVSFVQTIPYSTVIDGNCEQQETGTYSSPVNSSVNECIGDVPFGVQSPVEFMANFHGDCDTRTLFLFNLFDHYHYPAAILSSYVFHHSLLGLKLPLAGSAKNLGTARYVLWETTSPGFAAGQLNTQVDEMDYWEFTLIN